MYVRRSTVGRSAAALLMSATLILAAAGAAAADTAVHVVVSFDESKGQNPEGIAVDRQGTLFVSVSPLGDVWRIPVGSDQPQPFAHVDGIVAGRDFGLLGLAVDRSGNVYGAVQSANPDANGVWRFDADTGAATHLRGTSAMGIPNGLAFTHRGHLFVTDSARGAIWVIRHGGARAKIWLQDRALTGDGSLGLNLGVNGIAIRHRVLTVTNTERRTVLQIPRQTRAISLVRRLPEGDNPDGVTLDVFGDAFVALNLANAIAEVRPTGSMRIVASGDPLDFPSSLTFGMGHGERRTIYGVNFSISEIFGLPSGSGPGVFRLSAGVRGLPIP
jgi:DNA-binding beta-propeller fold protein YncE